jgi:hypothetical protein
MSDSVGATVTFEHAPDRLDALLLHTSTGRQIWSPVLVFTLPTYPLPTWL